MGFIKELNLRESKLLEQVLEIHLKGSSFLEKNYIDNLKIEFQDIYNLIMRHEKDDATIRYIRYRMFKAIRRYNKLGYVSTDIDKQLISKINELFIVYIQELQKCCITNLDRQTYMRRTKLTVKRINNIKDDVGFSTLQELNQIIKKVIKEISQLENNYDVPVQVREEALRVDKNFKIKNIYSYKDMCDLAVENGYNYLRSSGDHLIYKHDKSCRIVVIPAHTLTRGLSIEIQKQINSRKVN